MRCCLLPKLTSAAWCIMGTLITLPSERTKGRFWVLVNRNCFCQTPLKATVLTRATCSRCPHHRASAWASPDPDRSPLTPPACRCQDSSEKDAMEGQRTGQLLEVNARHLGDSNGSLSGLPWCCPARSGWLWFWLGWLRLARTTLVSAHAAACCVNSGRSWTPLWTNNVQACCSHMPWLLLFMLPWECNRKSCTWASMKKARHRDVQASGKAVQEKLSTDPLCQLFICLTLLQSFNSYQLNPFLCYTVNTQCYSIHWNSYHAKNWEKATVKFL